MFGLVKRFAPGLVIVLSMAAAAAALGWSHGFRLYIVHTGSMVPALRPGDAVLDAPAPASVHPGEVVTFTVHSGPDSVVTHRVASYSGGIIHTKGDANLTVDPWTLHLSQVVGTETAILPHVGYVLVYLKQPQGLASVITVMLGLIMLWQLFFPLEPTPRPSTGSGEARDAVHDRKPPVSSGPRHRSPVHLPLSGGARHAAVRRSATG
jgi:signal peptidase I